MDWLKNQGATLLDGGTIAFDGAEDGEEFPIHFPTIGPVVFWPTNINLPQVGNNSEAAKSAMIAWINQQRYPGWPEIDVDRSAVAGVKLPELRDGLYWVSGQIWFPTARLRESFAELNRVCQRLERLFGKHPTVFDNRKGNDQEGFGLQLCVSGIIQKIIALPEAYELLRGGAFMVDRFASSQQYAQFRKTLATERARTGGVNRGGFGCVDEPWRMHEAH